MTRSVVYGLLAVAAAVPRLAVVGYEREELVLAAAIVDRNVVFARTFVDSGTFGFTPNVPSAATQPLYGFFLIPLFRLFDGSWLSIGLAQTALSVATAWIVYEIARRLFVPRYALLAGLMATLEPYLIWNDVHVGREVLDGLLAAAVVLLALVAAVRPSLPAALALGAVTGIAILGNVRLVLLPLVVAAFLLWRLPRSRQAAVAAVAVIAASAVTIAPWVVRNGVQVGCFTLTTNARALAKANSLGTYDVLARGGWIDDVPLAAPPPDTYRRRAGRVEVDECAQMSFYERRVLEFWREHPDEKARLAGQATLMLWDPRARVYEVRSATGEDLRPVPQLVDLVRVWGEGLFMVTVYGLALVGLSRVNRAFAVLAVSLLAYQTLMAMVFAGTTRYRAPWDFLLVLLAVAGVIALTAPSSRLRRMLRRSALPRRPSRARAG